MQFFDKDGSGYITIDELQGALKDHGDAAQVAAHIQDILRDVDKDSDGRIDYEVGWMANFTTDIPSSSQQQHSIRSCIPATLQSRPHTVELMRRVWKGKAMCLLSAWDAMPWH